VRGLLPAALVLAGGSLVSGVAEGTEILEPTARAKQQQFVDLVRESTARYRDRARAVADGYRLIGRDFPGMGEHWIHIGLLFDGVYDPARPEFLTYVTIEGEPRLLGVAYGLPLLAGESPPDEPAGREAWHDHVGTLDEETLLPHHHLSGHAGHGPRLAMVHAWVWLENPDGLFAADNWSIPFARLGLEPPRGPAPAAAKALSLLTGGDEYVADVVARAQGSAEPARTVLDAIGRARGGVESLLHGRSRRPLGAGEIEALGALWEGLWSGIEPVLPAEAREALRASAVR
jgi:hypothetical protein